MKEKTISLMDLTVHILLRWRSILVALLVGGIILGSVGFFRATRHTEEQSRSEPEIIDENIGLTDAIQLFLEGEEIDLAAIVKKTSDADMEQYIQMLKKGLEDKLTEVQRNNIEYLLYQEEWYRSKEAYANESIRIHIDSEKIYRADATFLISSDDLEKTYNLEKIYEDIAFSPLLLEKMAAQAETTSFYISEIYTLSRGSAGKINGSDSFRVTIIHYDKAMCEVLLQTVVDYVHAKHGETAEIGGAHEVKLLNQSIGIISDRTILNAQYETFASLLNSKSTISNTKASFTDKEWYYYNLLAKGEIAGNPNNDSQAKSEPSLTASDEKAPAISIRYVASGALLAVILYVLVIFLAYVMNNKLKATDRLDDLYDIPQMGVIYCEQGKRKMFGFVDKWILSFCYRNQHWFSEAEALKLAASAIKIAAQKRSLDSVYLIGSELKGSTLEDCDNIKNILAESKISVRVLSNVLYDAEAMEKLQDVQYVVLVETAGATLYTEIADELCLLSRQNIQVLGGVVVA